MTSWFPGEWWEIPCAPRPSLCRVIAVITFAMTVFQAESIPFRLFGCLWWRHVAKPLANESFRSCPWIVNPDNTWKQAHGKLRENLKQSVNPYIFNSSAFLFDNFPIDCIESSSGSAIQQLSGFGVTSFQVRSESLEMRCWGFAAVWTQIGIWPPKLTGFM